MRGRYLRAPVPPNAPGAAPELGCRELARRRRRHNQTDSAYSSDFGFLDIPAMPPPTTSNEAAAHPPRMCWICWYAVVPLSVCDDMIIAKPHMQALTMMITGIITARSFMPVSPILSVSVPRAAAYRSGSAAASKAVRCDRLLCRGLTRHVQSVEDWNRPWLSCVPRPSTCVSVFTPR